MRSRRFALLLASLMPMLVWPFTGGGMAHPWQAMTGAVASAVFFAAMPGRGLKLALSIQTVAFPISLGWMGCVAVTGYGPSNAALMALSTETLREMTTALGLALNQPGFLFAALLSTLSLAWAWIAASNRGREVRGPKAAKSQGSAANAVFLLALLATAAPNLNGTPLQPLATPFAPEIRNTVVWFAHISLLKETGTRYLETLATGVPPSGDHVRSAKAAPKTFDAVNGIAVFMVGESMRADALLVEGRGPWSAALKQRLQRGLGVRLSDACAGGNATFTAVPRLLTAVDPADELGAAQNPTILAQAKAAGARTAYIVNHESWVVPESGHDYAEKTSAMERPADDQVALQALDSFLQRSGGGPRAALVHLYGQHFNYQDRYAAHLFPPEPSGLDTESLENLRYGRAAEAGTRILLEAAALLDRQTDPAFLIFTSDHGENLLSDHTGKRYHAGPVSGLFDTMVPALVLWNHAFAKTGRQQHLWALTQPAFIAHRDVAKAWLHLLSGSNDALLPVKRPHTWGALEAGTRASAIDCHALKP